MNKVFIDCGYHFGEKMAAIGEWCGCQHGDWETYAFEANPLCKIQERISQHPWKITAFNKAVWIADGESVFNCEGIGEGSTLESLSSKQPYSTQQTIETIDFSKFISQFRGRDRVFVKMDIEGAEYSVLRKLIQDDNMSIITELNIEWHWRALAEESLETTEQLLKEVKKYTSVQWPEINY